MINCVKNTETGELRLESKDKFNNIWPVKVNLIVMIEYYREKHPVNFNIGIQLASITEII